MPMTTACLQGSPDQIFILNTVRRSRGFTLLELLVVMLIISIITGFAVISVSVQRDDSLSDEIRRIQALANLAGEEAVLNGEELALEIDGEGYRFFILNKEIVAPEETDDGEENDPWVLIEEDRVFRAREWPVTVDIELLIEGEEVEFDKQEENGARIFISSSGEMSPFELVLTSAESDTDDEEFVLSGNIIGKIIQGTFDEDL
jgi:general secretion pathway protein H